MARLARSELGRLLFGAMLGRRKLRLEGFDMGFERSNDLIGQRSFVRKTRPQAATVRKPRKIVPTLRRTNPRSLIVSERLLPPAALGPLPNRLGRYAQQFGGLPVGKPLARQNCPPPKDVGRLRHAAAQRGPYFIVVPTLKTTPTDMRRPVAGPLQ